MTTEIEYLDVLEAAVADTPTTAETPPPAYPSKTRSAAGLSPRTRHKPGRDQS